MPIPTCEKHITNMFSVTFIPLIKTRYKPLPVFVLFMLGGAGFSPVYYPNYYSFQKEIYSIDIFTIFIIYTYLLYIYLDWERRNCFEHVTVGRLNENISLGFYILFMAYWLYDGVIQFSIHRENNVLIQIGNVYMSAAWYIYFSTSALLYYFICIKLAQRAQSINDWLKNIKRNRPPIADFYAAYKIHHKAIKVFGRSWNFIVLMGFVILTYHIPIDVLNVFINRKYTDIAGIVVKTAGLAWYTYKVCRLNDIDSKVIPYLYKHSLYSIEDITAIEKYALYHELGLNFYGIKLNGSLIIKTGLLLMNLIIPTIYALVSNQIFGPVSSSPSPQSYINITAS
jgi:hypothetical protein